MKYEKIWKKVLGPNEKVEYEFSVGNYYRRFYLIFCLVAGVILLFYSPSIALLTWLLGIFYFEFFIRWANAYAFTDKRILIYRGWLATELVSIDYDKITDIAVDEPIFDKLLTRSGQLIINTAGTGFPKLELKNIERPYEIKKKLDELRSAFKGKNPS